ncbi:MAG: DJ-1/PfpI family protein [Clostridia bacterium]|nr:DJ-1/PfpI family protein [Clostridia bacterium]
MLYILLADGFEETEAIAPIDVIRRANLPITLMGVTGKTVTGAHGIVFEAETEMESISKEDIDGVILPGGMPGTTNLQKDERVISLLEYCRDNNKLICAICAAPMILGELNMLKGREATCFPGFEEYLKGAVLSPKRVAVDGNFITSKGAGTALDFGGAIVNYFISGKGDEILSQMQCYA